MMNRQPRFPDNKEEDGNHTLGAILLAIAVIGLCAILIAQVWA